MMIEEQIENDAAAKISAQAAQFASDNPGKAWFKSVQAIGQYDIDFENVADFVKTSPACLVEYGGESVEDLDNAGYQSRSEGRIYVYVVTHGLWTHKGTSDDAFALCRAIKNALRGQVYQGADGVFGDYRYEAATPKVRNDGGLLMRALQFCFRTID